MNTSRKILLAAGAALAATAVASSAFAQNSATASASASVTIISPITLTKTADLSFGRYVLTTAGVGGSVTVSTAGAATTSGVNAVAGSGSTVTAAAFTVGGEVGQNYNISLPSSITLSDGNSHTMTVDTFTSNPSGSSTLATTNADPLTVGATLTISANQAAGGYTGTFPVTVTYQ